MLCLVANAASGAFGAIGIPVGVVETLKLPGDVSVLRCFSISNFNIGNHKFHYSILTYLYY